MTAFILSECIWTVTGFVECIADGLGNLLAQWAPSYV
jgi:hypothetical protein